MRNDMLAVEVRMRCGAGNSAAASVPGAATAGTPRPAAALILAVLALALAGCSRSAGGPPPIAPGTPCAACGMRIEDLRYACEEEWEGAFRAYDSIECLLRADPAPARSWLADYDTRTLHSADSMWVVRGEIPSPMGGGYAAFRERAAAEEIAAIKNGFVARLGEFASGSFEPDSAAGPGSAVRGDRPVTPEPGAGPASAARTDDSAAPDTAVERP